MSFFVQKIKKGGPNLLDQLDEILQVITKNGIMKYKQRNSKAPIAALEKELAELKYRSGKIIATKTKEQLKNTEGIIFSSSEALLEEVSKNRLTHWTPNVYRFARYSHKGKRTVSGHSEDNLKQINTFVVDVDSKKLHDGELYLACYDKGLAPTMILETPKGYQLYFILEEASYVKRNSKIKQYNYKQNDYTDNDITFQGVRVAKHISQNIREILSEGIPGVDFSANHFGFFRVPTAANVRYFNKENLYSFKDLIELSQTKDADEETYYDFLVEKYKDYKKSNRQIDQEWFKKLINAKNIQPKHEYGRNNAIFTLSLACYSSQVDENDCYNLMDQFNSQLDNPLSDRDVQRIVISAYSGKYNGARKDKIIALLETFDIHAYVGGFRGRLVYKHLAKKRNERQRSHYSEREQDLLLWINQNTDTRNPYAEVTQKELSEATKMARSTLNEVLKKSTKIYLTTKRGKGGKTKLASVYSLANFVMQKKASEKMAYYHTITALFPKAAKEVSKLFSTYYSVKNVQENLDLAELEDQIIIMSSPP